jgi:hypothetical protein
MKYILIFTALLMLFGCSATKYETEVQIDKPEPEPQKEIKSKPVKEKKFWGENLIPKELNTYVLLDIEGAKIYYQAEREMTNKEKALALKELVVKIMKIIEALEKQDKQPKQPIWR